MATNQERVDAALASIRADQKRQGDKIREILERERENISEESIADLEALAAETDKAADELTGENDDEVVTEP